MDFPGVKHNMTDWKHVETANISVLIYPGIGGNHSVSYVDMWVLLGIYLSCLHSMLPLSGLYFIFHWQMFHYPWCLRRRAAASENKQWKPASLYQTLWGFFKLVIWSPPPARLILPELPTSYVNNCNLSWRGVKRAPLSMVLEAEGAHWIKQMETCLIPETFSMHLIRISGYVCIHDVASLSLPSSTLGTFSICCRSDICRVLWFYWFS